MKPIIQSTWRWSRIGLVALLAWVGIESGGDATAQMGEAGQTIRRFEVPEFDRNNRLRSRLSGDYARILPSGLIDITGMQIEFYDPERRVEMRVTAESCIYNRQTGDATSDGRVRLARQNLLITGKGFTWEADRERMEIRDQARVVIQDPQRTLGEGGLLP